MTDFRQQQAALDKCLLRAEKAVDDARVLANAYWPDRVTGRNLEHLHGVVRVFRDRISTLREL